MERSMFVAKVKASLNVICSVFLIFLMANLLSSCRDREEVVVPGPVKPVKLHTVQAGRAQLNMSLPGRVGAARRSELSFKVSGPLEKLPIDEGQLKRVESYSSRGRSVSLQGCRLLRVAEREQRLPGIVKSCFNSRLNERDGVSERISQRILQYLNNTRASYPSINLSRDAVDAARRNLQLVSDSYVQGIKSIIDLLDAANAVYNFLIDLMGVQRSIGVFFTFMPAEEREVWIEKVKDYLRVPQ